MTKFYLPNDELGRINWFKNFAETLGQYASTFNLDAALLAQLQAEAQYAEAVYKFCYSLQGYSEGVTKYKQELLGTAKAMSEMVPPQPPPAMPPNMKGDVLGRARKLVRLIKAHPNYSSGIGEALGIVGAQTSGLSNDARPKLKVRLNAGHPIIVWRKGKASALKIYVDRGDGKGFSHLAIDTISPYPDVHPLPPSGTAALWKYKAIYLVGDEPAGQWSNIIEVLVSG